MSRLKYCKSIRTGVLAVAASLLATTSFAANPQLVDDQAVTLLVNARSLRWNLPADFSPSDRRAVCREVDDVCVEILDFQRDLYRGRSERQLCGELDDVADELCDLRSRLVRAGRSSARCGSSVDPLLLQLDELEAQRLTLHTLLTGQPVVDLTRVTQSYGGPVYGPATFGNVSRRTRRPAVVYDVSLTYERPSHAELPAPEPYADPAYSHGHQSRVTPLPPTFGPDVPLQRRSVGRLSAPTRP